MYVPEHFAESDRETLLETIREIGFGLLVGTVEGRPFATHLPFLVEGAPGEERLVAHMARANPHWRAFAAGHEALAVFQGPHAYVSPRWYESANAVPTWNYVAVHIYGVPRIVDNPERAYAAQRRLVEHYEAGRARPWRIEELDRAAARAMLRAIVNFEMPIARIEGKFKLSQNRTAADRKGVVAALEAEGDAGARAVAALMAAREAADRRP